MFRIRCRFYKKGDLIFISHLDLVRLMERALRRGGIPIAYSQGFNPHPILSFATALGVGTASESEYMDLQLDQKMEPEELIRRLNQVLPKGMSLLKAWYIDLKEPSLMAILRRSSYLVAVRAAVPVTPAQITEAIQGFLAQEQIFVMKEKKAKKEKFSKRAAAPEKLDIRPWIHTLEPAFLEGEQVYLNALLTTGSAGNLKPELLMKELIVFGELPLLPETIRIHRKELFQEKDGAYVPLSHQGL